MVRLAKVLAALAFFAILAANLPAQSIYATLTGVVSDPSMGLVGQATVRLRDEQSGSMRETVTNREGYYTFASVAVGTYELSVEAPGFATYKETGIALGRRRKTQRQRDAEGRQHHRERRGHRDLGFAGAGRLGRKIHHADHQAAAELHQVGSNAAEFIKIMPGFGVKNATNNAANYSGQTIGINANGNAGSQSPLNDAYSYNGLPGNTLDITADGAHVSDPGCNCDTPVNPNGDMIAEFKVTMSNFSAENQKGPAVISSVAKSGGQRFPRLGILLRPELRSERQ